ncbi:hypothetical protein [Myxococcus eversor]|uniref:hypothetical protein n=1 Tax=Myxococcus eversor TaxID=2709661 RepID=UPI0013D7C706|nr:hypothetical protein [Myxococcus eversor]
MNSRSATLLLGLVCLTTLPQAAFAQSNEGPFFSKAHLVGHWQNSPESAAIEISLNAYTAYMRSGFGPALRMNYFSCQDGLIRTDCNQLQGPFVVDWQLSAYLNASPGANHLRVYLDGNGFMTGFGPLFGTYYYRTCYGDTSPFGYGVNSYILMQSGSNIYGPVPGLSCLPRL